MSALAADIAPSPTTHVEIGTARSVSRAIAILGSPRVARSFSRRATSMWSSRFPVIWPRWSCRTRRSSTTSCFAPVRKPFSKWRAIPSTSVQKSASSACYAPGVKNSNFTCMCIAWCRPVGCLPIARVGASHATVFFLPVEVLGRVFRGKFHEALKRAFQDGQLNFHGDLQLVAQPKTFPLGFGRCSGTTFALTLLLVGDYASLHSGLGCACI